MGVRRCQAIDHACAAVDLHRRNALSGHWLAEVGDLQGPSNMDGVLVFVSRTIFQQATIRRRANVHVAGSRDHHGIQNRSRSRDYSERLHISMPGVEYKEMGTVSAAGDV